MDTIFTLSKDILKATPGDKTYNPGQETLVTLWRKIVHNQGGPETPALQDTIAILWKKYLINLGGTPHAFDNAFNFLWKAAKQQGVTLAGVETLFTLLQKLRDSTSAPEPDPAFALFVDTSNSGVTSTSEMLIPTNGSGYDCKIDWGDGTVEELTDADITTVDTVEGFLHDYGSSGQREIRITGAFPRIWFSLQGDKNKLLEIRNWGDVGFTSMSEAFYNCVNLVAIPDGPITGAGSVTLFSICFHSTAISSIPAELFDNTPNAADFAFCFRNTQLSSIPDGLFDNTPNAANFRFCFHSTAISSIPAELFDNTPNATNFASCFQNIGNLDVPSALFQFTVDPNISLAEVFLDSTIPTDQYSDLLINLDTHQVAENVSFHGGNSTYNSAGETARNNLTGAPRNWTITDGGLAT